MTPNKIIALCVRGKTNCLTPYGYCHCGCGRKTNPAHQTWTKYRLIAGEPQMFINGHHTRGRRFIRSPRHIPKQPRNGAYKLIALTNGFESLVSTKDFRYALSLNCYAWKGRDKLIYARTNILGKGVLLHSLLMPAPKGMYTDHINGNTLDNQRKNLQVLSSSQSAVNKGAQRNNKSGYKGVYWCKRDNVWASELKFNGIKYRLGYFNNYRDAVKARLRKEKEIFVGFKWTRR